MTVATGTAAAGIAKRSLSIAGHRTSVSLETPFWEALGAIARTRRLSVQALVAEIDAIRGDRNLSSALRVHVLETLQAGLPATAPTPPASGT